MRKTSILVPLAAVLALAAGSAQAHGPVYTAPAYTQVQIQVGSLLTGVLLGGHAPAPVRHLHHHHVQPVRQVRHVHHVHHPRHHRGPPAHAAGRPYGKSPRGHR